MTFTEVSDLNGGSPQFSLTCTSTGGPATTVTWTRDSQTVSGGVTVFNNAETAQYTHTLTVTERLGGQYQCNVTNNKPSSATAQLTVEGRVIIHSECDGQLLWMNVTNAVTLIIQCYGWPSQTE